MAGVLLLSFATATGIMVSCSSAGRGRASRSPRAPIFDRTEVVADTFVEPGSNIRPAGDTQASEFPIIEYSRFGDDSLSKQAIPVSDTISEVLSNLTSGTFDSIVPISVDSTSQMTPSLLEISENPDVVEQTGGLTIIADTTRTTTDSEPAPFLEAPVAITATDSTIYDVRRQLVYVFGQGDLVYEDNNLKSDRMILNAKTKEIYGVGVMDTVTGQMTRPEFLQGGATYTMDTITYNLETKKGKMKNLATKDGEGYLLGREFKKMDDNTINIANAVYTSCDRIEHPHYYIAMTKAKVIPGKKIITGPAYFVMEDVPIYFLGIPGGFFPIASGPKAGILFPKYGEETSRGFYLREGGYYLTFGDYADLALTGGIYTLGSWELNAQSTYVKRYKFSGSLAADYARTILGEKGGADYQNSGQFKLNWTHRQDAKANPRQTFSASVNFATAGYSKHAATTLQDHLNTQTSSSISYARNWQAGTVPINLTVAFNHSSNSRDSTIAITLPNVSFSVGSFAPFKRKVAQGKQRWYEKITMSYSMSAQNQTGPNTKERDLFSNKTLREMRNGVQHRIPVKTSFNILGYINFSPSFNYTETWNFKRQRKAWSPEEKRVVDLDPEFGFYRMYGWNAAGSFSTKIYGMYQFKRKEGKTGGIQAIRHVITPTVGVAYAPDFRHPRYGFVDYYQSDSLGNYMTNPNYFMGSPTMSPAGPNASLTFSLSNQVEMKVHSKRDTTGTGVKKVPIIEQFSLGGSYNFLADSMNLSNIAITLRSGQIFKNFAINLNATWDPYAVVDVNGSARRIKDFNIGKGKFGRIVSTGWSFGYTFNSSESSQPAINDINSGAFVPAYSNPFDHSVDLDPLTRRQYMVSSYYDFSIPWNFGFNYSVSYNNDGLRSRITQTLGFNGSVSLTQNLGVTFNGGFDIARRQFTPMQVNITRNLHCWNMSFQWIPIGQLKSYQFHIGINSSMLADIKYDKSSSRYDNLTE